MSVEGGGGNIVSSNLLKNEKCSVDSFSIELEDNKRNKSIGCSCLCSVKYWEMSHSDRAYLEGVKQPLGTPELSFFLSSQHLFLL